MTIDTELEAWRQEWLEHTDPLPELKKKIGRQNLRTAAAILAIGLCLAVSTIEALRLHSSFLAGAATGISLVSIFVGGYAWWVRRGAWKPAAQTTAAYAELCYKRAVAKARTVRFSFYFLLATVIPIVAFSAFHWRTLRPFEGVILAALVAELFWLKHFERRKRQEIEETKKLVESVNQ